MKIVWNICKKYFSEYPFYIFVRHVRHISPNVCLIFVRDICAIYLRWSVLYLCETFAPYFSECPFYICVRHLREIFLRMSVWYLCETFAQNVSQNVRLIFVWDICAIFLRMSVWCSHQTFLAAGRTDRATRGNNKIQSQISECQNSKCLFI